MILIVSLLDSWSSLLISKSFFVTYAWQFVTMWLKNRHYTSEIHIEWKRREPVNGHNDEKIEIHMNCILSLASILTHRAVPAQDYLHDSIHSTANHLGDNPWLCRTTSYLDGIWLYIRNANRLEHRQEIGAVVLFEGNANNRGCWWKRNQQMLNLENYH